MMKRFRKLFALIMVLALLLSMSISVFAVSTVDELAAAIGEGNTDVLVEADIDGEGLIIDISGKGVSINSEKDDAGNNKYTIGNIGFGADYENPGSATINMDTGTIGAFGKAEVIVNGDVTGADETLNEDGTVDEYARAAVNAYGESTVIVNGNVAGGSGNPDKEGLDAPTGYSDGANAIEAGDSATVMVNGNVSGGDAYGTYAYAGDGIILDDQATVVVSGNVTGGSVHADPGIAAENDLVSDGGCAIYMENSATVTVGGNVTGGSTNGDGGYGGVGISIRGTNEEVGSIAVGGSVTGGTATAENGGSGAGIFVVGDLDSTPSITVGSYDSISGFYVGGDETMDQDGFLEGLKASIVIITPQEEEPEIVGPNYDPHYGYLLQQIKKAKAGDEITTDVGARKTIPAAVIDAARKAEVKLIIKWTGGDDLVITKDFAEEVVGDVLLTELAEMLKK